MLRNGEYMKSLILIVLLAAVCMQKTSAQDYQNWFSDATQELGLDVTRGSRVSVADLNNDGWPDFIVGKSNRPTLGVDFTYTLYMNEEENNGNRIFVNRTEESGINARRFGDGDRIADVAGFADIDNDGDLDLITTIYYHRWEYYDQIDGNLNSRPEEDSGDRTEILLNDGNGVFTLKQDAGTWNMDIPDQNSQGLTNATGIATVDFDLDGDLDIFISQWFEDYRKNQTENPFLFKFEDLILENDGTGKFSLKYDSGLEDHKEANYGVNVLDWNNDGFTDIATSAYCRSGGYLFANMGDLEFNEVSGPANLNSQPLGGDNGQNLCQWEGSTADYDNDGDFDIFHTVVHGGMHSGEGRSFISENMGAEQNYRFEPRLGKLNRETPMSAHVSDMGSSWIDLDNDGLQDLIVAQSGYLNRNNIRNVKLFVFHQDEDHEFTDITEETRTPFILLDPHSPIAVDYDKDGDYDILTSYTFRDTTDTETLEYSSLKMLRNDIGNRNSWVGLTLKNSPSDINSYAIGSRVQVYSGDRTQHRELHNSQGHFGGQRDHDMLIGLGDLPFIDSVVVKLPNKSHTRKVFKDIYINKYNELDLTEDLVSTNSDVKIRFSIPKADLGTVNVGESKTIEVFAINDDDSYTINFTEVIINNPLFSIEVPSLPVEIKPGEELEFNVTFTPERRETVSAIAEFELDNGTNIPFYATAFGFEIQPMIAMESVSLEFDPVWIDSTITERISFVNTGETKLALGEITIQPSTAPFTVVDKSVSLAPGETGYAELAFTPDRLGDFTATAIIESNAYNTPNAEVSLTASSDGPIRSGSSSGLLPFGRIKVGESSTKSFRVESNGNDVLTVTGLSVDEHSEVFDLGMNDLPIEIQPNGTADLDIAFTPLEIDKSYNTIMTIVTDQNTEPITKNIFASSDPISSVPLPVESNIFYSKADKLLFIKRNTTENQIYGDSRIRISDVTGRDLMKTIEWQAGINQIELTLEGISGHMIISITDNEGRTGTYKLLVD
jgi:hypothetical protein